MKIDPAAAPFSPSPRCRRSRRSSGSTAALRACSLPVAIALFFRDPERIVAGSRRVLSPADGKVMYAGPASPEEAPAGEWQQVTIFLSLLDVHINRTPVAGRVTRVDYVPGPFCGVPPDAHANEHSEIWIDHGGVSGRDRQVVGRARAAGRVPRQGGRRLEAGRGLG